MTGKYTTEKLEREEHELLTRLRFADLSLSIMPEPTEESILNIIELVKSAERISGRNNKLPDKYKAASEKMQGDEVNKAITARYTWDNCELLAFHIQKIFNSDKLQLVFLRPTLQPEFGTAPLYHCATEFNNCFYDINGKHTKSEMQSYCQNNFDWNKAKVSSRRPINESEKEINDIVLNFCADKTAIQLPESKMEQN